jgi:hypothetical protein
VAPSVIPSKSSTIAADKKDATPVLGDNSPASPPRQQQDLPQDASQNQQRIPQPYKAVVPPQIPPSKICDSLPPSPRPVATQPAASAPRTASVPRASRAQQQQQQQMRGHGAVNMNAPTGAPPAVARVINVPKQTGWSNTALCISIMMSIMVAFILFIVLLHLVACNSHEDLCLRVTRRLFH